MYEGIELSRAQNSLSQLHPSVARDVWLLSHSSQLVSTPGICYETQISGDRSLADRASFSFHRHVTQPMISSLV
jgi:hypothetical protein